MKGYFLYSLLALQQPDKHSGLFYGIAAELINLIAANLRSALPSQQMSSGSPSVESSPSSHLSVKLPPGSTSLGRAGHCFFILRIWSPFSPNPWGQFLWEDHCVWTMNSLQDTIKMLERKHFFVHILRKSREPSSEALHSDCIQITPPGSSVNNRKTQRSRELSADG